MRLLIPVDTSPEAREAADFAGLLHALIPGAAMLLSVAHSEDDYDDGFVLLDSIQSENPRLGDFASHVRIGKTVDEIVAEANSGGYDLIVMGQRGQSRFAQMLIGNTALQIMSRAVIPLVILHESRSALQRVLVCSSGSDYARSNVEQAAAIANEVGANLTILHVMSQVDITPGSPSPELGQAAAWHIDTGTDEGHHLAELTAIAEGQGVDAKPLVRYGLVVDEILNEARSSNCDLVVLGAHHREGLAGFLLNDITREVISQLRRPVMIVR